MKWPRLPILVTVPLAHVFATWVSWGVTFLIEGRRWGLRNLMSGYEGGWDLVLAVCFKPLIWPLVLFTGATDFPEDRVYLRGSYLLTAVLVLLAFTRWEGRVARGFPVEARNTQVLGEVPEK
jgi:hypothetical protein